MNTLSITDIYMGVLNSLTDEDKIDLASKLLASIKKKVHPRVSDKADPFFGLSDAWDDGRAPEEIAEDFADGLCVPLFHAVFLSKTVTVPDSTLNSA